jgi:hypothetical protein
MPRPRPTIGQLMILVAAVGVIIALELNRWRLPLLLLGPLAGAILQMSRGGNGILGGMLGGGAAWAVSGLVEFAIYHSDPRPHYQWGLRQQATGILAFSAIGAVVGIVIGASVGRASRRTDART